MPRRLSIPFRLLSLSTLALGAAGLAFLATSGTGYAEVQGDCDATIAGVDISGLDSNSADDAIDVDYNDRIVATMSSASGFESHKIKLRFVGGVEVTVEDRDDNGELSFEETVDVSDYAWAGVGLYKVKGTANVAGGFTCSGAALVNVTGRNPITTVLGGGATALVVAGTAGAAASAIGGIRARPGPLRETQEMVEEAFQQDEARREQSLREYDEASLDLGYLFAGVLGCWCVAALSIVMVPLMALTGAGGVPPSRPAPAGTGTVPPRRLRRPPLLPRITLAGLVGGLLAGAGGVVLLQQFAITYPTTGLAIMLLVIGALVYGLALPTLGYVIGWWRVRRRIDELERSIGWQ
jgi:hypothetical protein